MLSMRVHRKVHTLFAALFSVSALTACNTTGTHNYDKRIDNARFDPPQRYAGEYKGKLHVMRLPPIDPNAPDDVLRACARLGVPSVTGKPRGCYWLSADKSECWIVIIDRPAYGTTPEAVLAHELGHANGWPAHHPR